MKSDLVKEIKRIEMSAYPYENRMLQDADAADISDIVDYADAEDDVVILQEDNWYAIIGISGDFAELVDLASDGGVKNIFRIIRKILDAIPENVTCITGDFRESTSYRLVKLSERYGWRVIEDSISVWGPGFRYISLSCD